MKKFLFIAAFLASWLSFSPMYAQNVAKIGSTEYATLQAAFDAATDGQTVTLLADYDATGETNTYESLRNLCVIKSITVDGQRHTLTVNKRGVAVKGLSTNVDVTFKDITIQNSGSGARCIDTRGNIGTLTLNNVTLNTQGASGTTQPLTIGGNRSDAATVSITNSTIQTNNDGTAYYAIITFNPVNMTITNSTLKGWACIYAKGPDGSAGSAGSVFTLDDCTIVSSNIYSGNTNSFAAFKMEDNNVTINVTNSNITINNSGDQDQAIATYKPNNLTGKVSLGEGNNVTFNSTGTGTCSFETYGGSATFEVSGGTFNVPVPEEYCAEDFIPTDNGDGTYGVKAAYVAQIGTTKYETLQAAVAAATDGATIQVIKAGEYAIPAITKNLTIEATVDDVVVNHEANSAITTIASGKTTTFKNITFNLGTLALPTAHGFGTANGSNGSLVMDGCTINGALNLFGASTLTNCTFNAEGIYNIWAVNDDATFTDCTFNNTNRAVNVYDQKKSSTTKNVSFSNCTFAGSAKKKAAVNIHHNPDGTAAKYAVSITACTTTGTWASTVEETGEPDEKTICYSPLWMISDIVNWNDGDIAVTVDGVAQDVSKFSPVAQIGNTKYETLQAAIDAATAGATIDILADFDLTTVSTTVNGNASDKYNVVVGKNLTINGNGHAITASTGKRAIAVEGTANLTINNLTVNGNKATGVVWMLSTGTLTLDNGTVLDGTSYNEYNQVLTIGSGLTSKPTINVNNSTIKTNNEGSAHYDIILWSPANVNITNSTMLGWAAIYVKPAAAGSNVSVSNSTITSKGYSGNSNDFGIFSSESDGNTFTLDGNTYNITAQTGTYNTLININGASNNTVNITNTTAYNTNDTNYGGIIRVGDIDSNSINLDATSAQTLQDEIQVLVDAGATTETSNGITTLSFVAEVYYYWIASGVEEGEKCTFAEPFTNGWLANGEFIRLQKDVTLSANVACQLTSGSFTLTQGAFAVTKGEYAVTLKNGVSVVADKQTDIFAAADAANYTISETEDNGTYTYTVTEKSFVAQIGDDKYETLAEAVAAVPAGTETTITMIANETITTNVGVTIPSGANVVLELNGKTITQTSPGNATGYLIKNNGTLTIQDNTDTNADGTGTGKMLCSATNPDTGGVPSYANNLISNYGTLTIVSGYYEVLTNAGYASYVVDNYSGGTANITGGKLTNNAPYAYVVRMFLNSTTATNALNISGTAVITGSYAVWMQYANGNANKASLNISGGTINATDGRAVYAGAAEGNTRNATNIEVSITGGTILGTGAWFGADTEFKSFSVTGGTFADFGVSAVGGDGIISGGTFISTSLFSQTRTDATSILVEGYLPVWDSTKNAYVVSGPYAAKIGTVGYATFAEAVTAAEGTQTITLLADVAEAYTLAVNETLIVKLNGHTLTVNAPTNYNVVTNTTTDGVTTYTTQEKPIDQQDIELVDGQPYTFTQDTEVASATYVRTLGENLTNVYLPWYVPFDYTITSEDAENLTFYRINMIANSPQQGEVQETDKVWIFVTPMAVGDKLTANRPYLFKSKAAETFTFTTTGATLYAPATDARLENSTSVYKYEFYGTYGPTQLAANSYNYYMTSKGQITYPGDSPINLKPYRWYIKATAKANGGAYAPAFVFIEDEDDDATGIKLEGNTQAGESYYNLNGMRINKPTSGAYIIKYSDGSSKKIIK